MSRKNAPAASTALSLAEYIDNYPGMPEGARAVMLLLKLDIISCLNYAWREAHNKILLRRSIALDCLRRTLPPIDDDQKLALLHATFKGTALFGGELAKLQEANLLRRSIALDCLRRTLPPIDDDQKLALLHATFKGTALFGGELAKLQEANRKHATIFTVFPQPTAPPASYSTRRYVGRGRRGFKKSGGRGRGQGRSTPSATNTKPGQSKESQKSLTVSVSSDTKKRKVESRDNAPQTPRKTKRNFRGAKNQGNKQ